MDELSTLKWEARYGKSWMRDRTGPFAGAAGHEVEDQQVLDIYEGGQLLFRGHWGNHAKARLGAAAPALLKALSTLLDAFNLEDLAGFTEEQRAAILGARSLVAGIQGEADSADDVYCGCGAIIRNPDIMNVCEGCR